MIVDNQISRIVRPGILIWLTVLFSALMLLDGNWRTFQIKEVYIGVLETIMVAAYAAYFLGKSGEKISHIRESKYMPRRRRGVPVETEEDEGEFDYDTRY